MMKIHLRKIIKMIINMINIQNLIDMMNIKIIPKPIKENTQEIKKIYQKIILMTTNKVIFQIKTKIMIIWIQLTIKLLIKPQQISIEIIQIKKITKSTNTTKIPTIIIILMK